MKGEQTIDILEKFGDFRHLFVTWNRDGKSPYLLCIEVALGPRGNQRFPLAI